MDAHAPIERLGGWIVDDDDTPESLSTELTEALPANAATQVLALAMQKAGDLVVAPKTVLTWLLVGVGAPAAAIGMLVPIRESGSMLPQAALVPFVTRRAVRKWLWVAGAGGQAAAVATMALLAATTSGALAGWGILAALAVFATSRSLSSLASKDVLGRTVPAGQRGRINGTATVASGVVAITLGLALRTLGGEETSTGVLAALLGAAALAWVAAGAVYARIEEPAGEHDPNADARSTGRSWQLLRDDAAFRRFVVARALLLVSALSPPFVVALATTEGGGGLAGLGPFVISSGIAALLGGRLWGRAADRSSRLTMVAASGLSAAIVAGFLLVRQTDGLADTGWLAPLVFLLLAIVHTGARVGRKTYVVDLADGDQRTQYVAVSNAAIGGLLLVTGVVTSALATIGPQAALLLLAVMGALGVPVGLRLPETAQVRPEDGT